MSELRNQLANVALPRSRIHGHDCGVQIIGKGNRRKQQRECATQRNGFAHHSPSRVPPRRKPPQAPHRCNSQRDGEPNKIENRFHLPLSKTKPEPQPIYNEPVYNEKPNRGNSQHPSVVGQFPRIRFLATRNPWFHQGLFWLQIR